jgi:hypothetical protein
MPEVLDIKSEKFLGGKNVHSLLILAAVGFTAFKLGAFKK